MLLSTGKVLVCGGGLGLDVFWASVYVVKWDGSVQKRGSLVKPRCAHGVIEYGGSVYVFGGECTSHTDKTQNLKECERLHLKNARQTESLPSLREGKHSFNPCFYLEFIYISGHGSTLMEAFSPVQSQFSAFTMVIPQNHACCIYTLGEELVVHTLNMKLRYAVRSSNRLVEVGRKQWKAQVVKVQCTQPVVERDRGVVYYVWDGRCRCFDIKSGDSGPTFS